MKKNQITIIGLALLFSAATYAANPELVYDGGLENFTTGTIANAVPFEPSKTYSKLVYVPSNGGTENGATVVKEIVASGANSGSKCLKVTVSGTLSANYQAIIALLTDGQSLEVGKTYVVKYSVKTSATIQASTLRICNNNAGGNDVIKYWHNSESVSIPLNTWREISFEYTPVAFGTTGYFGTGSAAGVSVQPIIKTEQLTAATSISMYFDDFSIKAKECIWNGSAWNPALTSTSDALIDGNFNGAGFSCKNLTVNAGKQFTLASGALSVAGNLVLNSDATNGSATYVNNGGTLAVSGTTSVQQYLSAARNWYMSSPLTATAPTGFTYYKYDEKGENPHSPDNLILNESACWTNVTSGSALTPGVGYVALPGAAASTITFTSATGTTFNTGDKEITLTATNAGYNLIGNPYPSHLTWTSAFLNANSTLIGPSIWYRTNSGGSNTSGWTFPTINIASSESTLGATAIIPPNQAFWVKAKTPGTLTLNSSLTKSHQTGNGLKAPAVKNTDRKRLRLEVSNGTAVDEAVVYFDAEALNTFDNYDSPKKFNNSTSVPDIYTVVGSEKLVINGLNQVENNMEMIVGFNSLVNANFTLKTTEMTNFDADTKVYLRDKIANTETELLPATEYAFASDITTNNETRFSLIFKTLAATTGLENKLMNTSVFVNATNETVIIAPEDTQYSVYNAVGQRLTNGITKTNLTIVNTEKAGIYIVKLANHGLSNSYRLIVR